jgi:hypothetical protein
MQREPGNFSVNEAITLRVWLVWTTLIERSRASLSCDGGAEVSTRAAGRFMLCYRDDRGLVMNVLE